MPLNKNKRFILDIIVSENIIVALFHYYSDRSFLTFAIAPKPIRNRKQIDKSDDYCNNYMGSKRKNPILLLQYCNNERFDTNQNFFQYFVGINNIFVHCICRNKKYLQKKMKGQLPSLFCLICRPSNSEHNICTQNAK